MYYALGSHQSMTCGYFVKKCAEIHQPRTYQVVCGDFNADLASDVALCDLLSEQGLLLAWRGEDVKDWVGRCCGEFVLLFLSFRS